MRTIYMDRRDALSRAAHAVAPLNDEALRLIIRQCIDTYYFSDPSIERRAAKTGEALREEAALHLAGLMYQMDTDPDGTEDRERLFDVINQTVDRDDFDARIGWAHFTNAELKAELDAIEALNKQYPVEPPRHLIIRAGSGDTWDYWRNNMGEVEWVTERARASRLTTNEAESLKAEIEAEFEDRGDTQVIVEEAE